VSDDLLGVLRKLNALWLVLGMTALGVLLGLALTSPLSNLTVSIVGILVHLVTILASPLNGLLLWMVSNPFGDLYINISLGASLPDLSPTRFCVAFLCILLLAQAAIRKRKLAPFTSTDMVGILLMIGLGLSVINEYSTWQETIQGIFDEYYVPLLVYFFAKNLVTQRQDVNKVLGAVLFFGVYAALYAIYENRTGNILFFRGTAYFTMYGDSGLHVLRGLLSRSDHFGALFSMVIPVGFYLYLKARTPTEKGLYVIVLGILFIGIYLTYKRTAWIAIGVIGLVIQWFYPQFRRLFLVLLLVCGAMLAATWNTVSQSAVVTDRINSKNSTMDGRTDGWNAAIELWAQQPLFGYGFNNYETVAEKKGVDDAALENEHLGILFSAGLLGFVPYVAWFVLILRDSIRLFRRSQQNGGEKPYVDKDLAVIFWGVLLGYLINYSTATAGIFSVTMVFYMLTGSIVGSQARFLASSSQNGSSTRYPVSAA
jgi:O-antigen ligase